MTKTFLTSLGKLLTGLVFISLAACSAPPVPPPPTPTAAAILQPTSTQAAATAAPSAAAIFTATQEFTATAAPTVTEIPSSTAEISATETPEPSPTNPPSTSNTQNVVFDKAQLVTKANVEDQLMDPGHSFTMSWTWKNVAATTWTTDYALVFYGGDLLGAKTRVAFPGKVNPGDTIELSVNMKVPDSAQSGSLHSFWALVNQNGDLFHIVGVTIQVK